MAYLGTDTIRYFFCPPALALIWLLGQIPPRQNKPSSPAPKSAYPDSLMNRLGKKHRFAWF